MKVRMNRFWHLAFPAIFAVIAGCSGPPEQPYDDPEFEFLLFMEPELNSKRGVPAPPIKEDSQAGQEGERNEAANSDVDRRLRFGGPIAFDEGSGVWREVSGKEADFSNEVEALSKSLPQTTVIRTDPSHSVGTVSLSLAHLGQAGICQFEHFEADSLREGTAPKSYYGTAYRLIAFKSRDNTTMLCREGGEPEPAERGYSLHSSFCTLGPSSRATPNCVG